MSSAGGQSELPDGMAQLAETVARLRAEVDGLRAAMRRRAVIEQAKGVLASYLGISLADAFDRLRTLSQTSNRKLGEVAEQVMAVTTPPPVATISRTYGFTAATSTPSTPSAPIDFEAVALLQRLPHPGPQPDRGVEPVHRIITDLIGMSAEDEESSTNEATLRTAAERIQASHTPAELLNAVMRGAAWPPGPHVGLLYLLEPEGSLRLLASDGLEPHAVATWRRVPVTMDMPGTVAARFGVPILLDDPSLTAHRFPQALQLSEFPDVSAHVPLVVGGNVTGMLSLCWPQSHRFTATDRRYLLALVDLAADTLAGLTIDDPSAAVGTLPGGRPGLNGSTTNHEVHAPPATWIEQSREHELLAAADADGIGLWVFHPDTNTMLWNDAMYRILGREPADGPLALEALDEYLHLDDWHVAAEAVRQAIVHSTPIRVELRLIRSLGKHRVSVGVYPQRDNAGMLLRGTCLLFEDEDPEP